MSYKFTSFVIVSVGLLFLAPALLMGLSLWSFMQDARFAQGTVVGLTEKQNGMQAPKVRFKTAKTHYTFQSNTYVDDRYRIGDRVEVIYTPSNPMNAAVYTLLDMWGTSILFGILGTPFFLMGLYMLVRSFLVPSPIQRYSPPA